MAIDCGGEILTSSCDRFDIKLAVGGTQVVKLPMTLLFSLLSCDRFNVGSGCEFVDCFLTTFSLALIFNCGDGKGSFDDTGGADDSDGTLFE